LVLANDNATLRSTPPTAAARLAERAVEGKGAEYADEIRRLLDAALHLMGERGTAAKPRVADIVAAAGLSNDAFYRHFPSKDALVAAILEDGAERLTSYLTHQMDKERTPEGQVRCWVAGVLAQADDDTAATTRAVLWNSGNTSGGLAAGRHPASGPLAKLLEAPFTELGSRDAELDATLVAHAVLGRLSDHLWDHTAAGRAEVAAVTAFALAVSAHRA
jgi:AcrR family transcriptional regulator